MKKLLIVIPLACMLACSNGNKLSPSNPTSPVVQDKDYGTVLVALPKVAISKSSSEKFIFDLAITGPGMEPMKSSWYLSGADTQATMSRIPPGDMRIFTGTLTSTVAGVTHIGSDTVAIVAGKTAYVSLYLRKTGNAVVDIIIENDKTTPGMSGCYTFQGRIDTGTLNNMTLQILSDSMSPDVFGYIRQNGNIIGKMNGPQPSFNKPVIWYLSAYEGLMLLKVNGDKTGFKGIAYKPSDTLNSVGYASGYRTSCDTVVPPPPPPPIVLTGCYGIVGGIDTIRLEGTILHVLSDSLSSMMYGEVLQNGKFLAKVSGPQPSRSAPVYWQIGFAFAPGPYLLKIYGNDRNSFKGSAYKPSDTLSSVGGIGGNRTSCDTAVPPPPPPAIKLQGCYRMDGNIDTFALKNMVFRVTSDTSSSYLNAIISQNGTPIAKVDGPQLSAAGMVNWHVGGFANGNGYMLKAYGSQTDFKGIAFRQSDTTTSVGTAYGFQVPCDTVVINPTCVVDTMGSESSCKDMATWQSYASESCTKMGMILTWVNPIVPCPDSKEKAFRWVCFECCKK